MINWNFSDRVKLHDRTLIKSSLDYLRNVTAISSVGINNLICFVWSL